MAGNREEEKIEVEEKIGDIYEELECLLIYFMEDGWDQETKDEDTIARFISEMDSESIRQTIKEGREVLSLKPFPHKWIGSVMNAGWKTDEECQKWINWMLEEIEREAKRVGKI